MVPHRILALVMLLAVALPTLAAGGGCCCPRPTGSQACCGSQAKAVSMSAPRGCCPDAVKTASRPAGDLTPRTLVPARPDAVKLLAVAAEGRGPALPAWRASSPRIAPLPSETPPATHLLNCVLLI